MGNGGYVPFARCWVCGKESPNDLPTYATVKEYMERNDNG